MALEVSLSTLAGEVHKLKIEQTCTIGDLRQRARELFGRPVQTMISEQGYVLSPPKGIIGDSQIIQNCVIQVVFGNAFTVFSNHFAFAVVKEDGSVVTWGFADYGGDSTVVQDQLANV